jgi:hypothetical protein
MEDEEDEHVTSFREWNITLDWILMIMVKGVLIEVEGS